MELKWLEDFISLAETRSFSRSAENRHVTQSAFSRRIRALELWLGASLVDRSTYPTTLTQEGRQFRETAEETVRMLHASRVDMQTSTRSSKQKVAIAALHTLSLSFFPRWFRRIENESGRIDSRLLPDDFHNCLQAVVEGGYDFLLTFHHQSVPILLDPDLYPHLVVGTDRLVAVKRATPDASSADEPVQQPMLGYARGSFLGRVATFAQAQAGASEGQVVHTNENAMAEALKFMVLEGHGLAWVPYSIVENEIANGSLVTVGPQVAMEVRLYRNTEKTRPAVERVWKAAQALIAETM